MNKKKQISIAAAILCATVASVVHAQTTDYNPSWYVAPTLIAIDPDSGFGIDNRGEGVGIRLGKPLSESWDVQLGTSYARSRDDGVHYQQNMLGADFLYMFSRSAFRPFVLVGAGYQEDRLSTALGQTSGYSPYVNAGLGAQLALDDQWSLQADFRRVHGYLRNSDFPIDRSSNNYLSVGFTYAFDKPSRPAVVSAPPPEPTPVAVVETPRPPAPPPPPAPRFEKITLSSTELFVFAKWDLQMPQPKLDEIAAALSNNPQVDNVVITGYTDRIGSDKYNQKLSERRANAVKDYLVGKGIGAGRLSAVGKGKANAVVDCKQTRRAELIKCLEPNRRVEIEQIAIERRVN
jgi:OOP family OmpA-OmpF porin